MLEPKYSSFDINRLPDPRDHKVKIRKRRFFRKLTRFLVVFLFIGAIVLTYKALSTSDSQYLNQDHSLSLIEKLRGLLTRDSQNLNGEKDDRVNILLLGMGGAGHDGPYLTDTILVASYKPSNNTLALLSIPRDLALYIPDYGFQKINSVNSAGEVKFPGSGGDYTRVVVSELLGLDIPYYIRVDFKSFEQVVDDLNGISVNVERSFTDYQYPTDDYKYQVISFKQGTQTMDGATALKYVRSRHGCCSEGGDFARARRQQIFLNSLKEKIITEKEYLDPKQLLKLYNNYQENVTSNLKVWEVIRLVSKLKDMQNENIIHFVLTNGPQGELEDIIGTDGAYMLQPKDGNYGALKIIARDIFEKKQVTTTTVTEPQKIVEPVTQEKKNIESTTEANIVVLNGTEVNGLATQTSKELEEMGYNIIQIGNAPQQTTSTNYIYDTTKGKFVETVESLQKKLSAKTTSDIPDWLNTMLNSPDTVIEKNAHLVIVLGTSHE